MKRLDVYRRLFRYLKPYWKQATISLYVQSFWLSASDLLIPQVIKACY